MVVCQVMVDHTIICKIQVSRLTTFVCNESRCSCNCTEILVFLTTKLELPSPLLSDSPFSPLNSFFVFLHFRLFGRKIETHLLTGLFTVRAATKFQLRQLPLLKFHCQAAIESKVKKSPKYELMLRLLTQSPHR
jgi:hypothetical protein